MPLLNAAICSHSPILIPEIGKLNYNILKKTADSYSEIARELQGNDIETIIIISPHGQIQSDRFTINVGPELAIDLSSFGFLGNTRKFLSDLEFIDELKKTEGPEIQLISEAKLDYGASVPLHLLTSAMPDVKIVVISYAGELDLANHFNLGYRISQVISGSAKRIALIASGDLSHRLKKTSPNGYSPKGSKFDNKLIELLNNPTDIKNNILSLDTKLIKDAGECGLKSIVTLLGALEDKVYTPEIMSYQTDFGIGYLMMNFKL
ncbi:MAG: class III extradiol dioxygenase subunit B-like domain-containing protein [Candidatus Falkowbacteria bacterium]